MSCHRARQNGQIASKDHSLLTVTDFSPPFQVLLGRIKGVFPFLAIMIPINDPVDGIFAQIGVNRMNSPMNLASRLWAEMKQMKNGAFENLVGRNASSARPENVHLKGRHFPIKLANPLQHRSAFRGNFLFLPFGRRHCPNLKFLHHDFGTERAVANYVRTYPGYDRRFIKGNAVFVVSPKAAFGKVSRGDNRPRLICDINFGMQALKESNRGLGKRNNEELKCGRIGRTAEELSRRKIRQDIHRQPLTRCRRGMLVE